MDNSRRTVVGLLVVVAGSLSSFANGATWYVDDDNCPGPGSGTSGDPYCQIQTAINVALPDDLILVSPGTYDPFIIGGNTITVRSTDGPEVTTIFGNASPAITIPGDCLIEGFTITHPYFPQYNGHGGGIQIPNASTPTIRNCRIIACSIDSSGGGIYIMDDGWPLIEDCLISGNSATGGDGIYAENDGSGFTMINCVISSNAGQGVWGGGLVSNCEIRWNTYEGLHSWVNGVPLDLQDTIICGNGVQVFGPFVDLGGNTIVNGDCPVESCAGDVNGDNQVGILDFLTVLANWGPCQ